MSHRPPLAPAPSEVAAAAGPEPVAARESERVEEMTPAPVEVAEEATAPATAGMRAKPVARPVEPIAASTDGEKPSEPAEEPGQNAILIVSEPAGSVVVVDGRPVGPAPVQVRVPVTDRGYLRRHVSVKVRFLAGGTTTQSHTVEMMLTPLDRVPTRIDFTPSGARRTLAAFK